MNFGVDLGGGIPIDFYYSLKMHMEEGADLGGKAGVLTRPFYNK